MKQFNLEEYLRLKEEGKEPKIVTRNGHSARIICTDRKSINYPIVALINYDGAEYIWGHNIDGRVNNNPHIYDLFFASTKHEGWINVYPSGKGYVGGIYATEEEAKKNAGADSIATVRIEWTE